MFRRTYGQQRESSLQPDLTVSTTTYKALVFVYMMKIPFKKIKTLLIIDKRCVAHKTVEACFK